MKKILILLALVSFLLAIAGLGAKNLSSIRKQEQLKELDNADDRTSIAWHLSRAKITGDKEIVLPGYFSSHAVVKDLNQALTLYKVISAVPIEKYVTSDKSSIITWYKFKIIEDLSSKQAQECVSCDDSSSEDDYLPAALLPVEPDEILISHLGGDVIIDGIRVTQPVTIHLDFSTGSLIEDPYTKKPLSQVAKESKSLEYLSSTKPFLLFVKASKSGKVGGLALGDRGVFSYGPNGEVKSINRLGTYNVLKADLEKLKINSSEKLKVYTQQIR